MQCTTSFAAFPEISKKLNNCCANLVNYRRNNRQSRGTGTSFAVVVGQTFSPQTVEHSLEVRDYAASMGMPYSPQLYEEFAYYSNTRDTIGNVEIQNHIEGAAGHHESDLSQGLDAYPRDPLPVIKSLPYSFTRELLLKVLKTNRPALRGHLKMRNFCASMNKFMLLRSNGDVAPCLRWCNMSAGNVRAETPSAMWASEGARNTRRVVRGLQRLLKHLGDTMEFLLLVPLLLRYNF